MSCIILEVNKNCSCSMYIIYVQKEACIAKDKELEYRGTKEKKGAVIFSCKILLYYVFAVSLSQDKSYFDEENYSLHLLIGYG